MPKVKRLMNELFCPECDTPLSMVGRYLDKGWCGREGHTVVQVYQFSLRRRLINCVVEFLIKVWEIIRG